MRRKVCFGIFYGIVLLAIVSGVIFMNITVRQSRSAEEFAQEEPFGEGRRAAQSRETDGAATPESSERSLAAGRQLDPQYKYLLQVRNGELSVYDAQTSKLYLDTGIRLPELPDYVRLRVDEGMGFYTEEELFAFLESYSS